MATEATASSPPPTVTTATEAPTAGATTATVPGTDLPAHPDAPGKIDLKQFFADRYATKHAVKPASGTVAATPAPKAAPAAIPAPAVVPVAEAPKTTETASAVEEKPKEAATAEQDEIDKRLARLAAAGEAAARERKMRERERAASAKVKEAETSHAKEIELARKIQEAQAKGSKLALLEALGQSKEQLSSSGWVVDLLNELGDQETPPNITRAEAEAIAQAKAEAIIKAREDAAKEAEEKAKAEREASLAEAKAVFFSQVKVEYKSGSYPALKADGATNGQLDAFYQAHLARNPGQYWTAKELLDRAEAHTVAFYEAQEKKISELKAKLKPATPAAKTPAASPTRTVTPSTVADAGPVTIEPPKKLDIKEKQRKARDEFAAKFAQRAR